MKRICHQQRILSEKNDKREISNSYQEEMLKKVIVKRKAREENKEESKNMGKYNRYSFSSQVSSIIFDS